MTAKEFESWSEKQNIQMYLVKMDNYTSIILRKDNILFQSFKINGLFDINSSFKYSEFKSFTNFYMKSIDDTKVKI